jgi:hypothetical protein
MMRNTWLLGRPEPSKATTPYLSRPSMTPLQLPLALQPSSRRRSLKLTGFRFSRFTWVTATCAQLTTPMLHDVRDSTDVRKPHRLPGQLLLICPAVARLL